MPRSAQRASLLLVAVLGLACATNPVTGQREIVLLSESREIAMGERMYAQTRQASGGDYTVDPELTVYVAEVGERVAAASDRPQLPYEFHVLNESTPNAWALPGGKIAVNRGLLVELESEAELAALLGHEVTHAAARHSAQAFERGLALQGVLIATSVAVGDESYAPYAVVGAGVAATLVNLRYGRDDEREADYYGTLYIHRAGYDPMAAVSLQEVLLEKSEAGAPGWVEGLFRSHPHSAERVVANRESATALAAEGKPGGELGEERFQSAIASLVASQEYYAAYDAARKASSEGRWEEARGLAAVALAGKPKEPRFHTLQGQLLLEERAYAEAVESYDRAIELDGSYFLPYLRRGQARRALGDAHGARADLERSVRLLPTAEAQVALGEIAEKRGARSEALAYYRPVAAHAGPLGARARVSIARLELPHDPGAYLSARPLLATDGSLWIEVGNRAPLAVRDVVVELQFGSGRAARVSQLRVWAEIPAGETRNQATGIGPIRDPASLAQLELRVVGARIAEQGRGAR
ncbi:MAG: M48 family metalloprotease [Myxococcales bacterium]|nr:M48 family metalloprotease [Myxococcales bacterium]